MSSVKKISLCAILTALSLLSFMLENLFPPLFIPGARMGISNVFVLLSLIILGAPYGFFTLVIKCVLGSVFSGNVSAIMYSLPGGIVALTLETALIYLTGKISVVAISVAGAVINSLVQDIVFYFVTKSLYVITYLPYLVLIGAVSGFIVGLIIYFVVKALPKG